MNPDTAPSTPTTPASTTAATATCPECEATIVFPRVPRRFEVCRCGGCGSELEVTTVQPLTLQLAPEIEEDWGE